MEIQITNNLKNMLFEKYDVNLQVYYETDSQKQTKILRIYKSVPMADFQLIKKIANAMKIDEILIKGRI